MVAKSGELVSFLGRNDCSLHCIILITFWPLHLIINLSNAVIYKSFTNVMHFLGLNNNVFIWRY